MFSWQELSENLFTTTPDSFDSHTALEELQTDRNPTLYLFSAAAVFLAYVFHLGFVPALMLGRTANLIVFALLAALAVKAAPFGRRVFAAAALLPMTLHLAASFSRDSLLLGLAFAFTALCMQAIFGCKDGTVLPVRLWLPLAVFGIRQTGLPAAGSVVPADSQQPLWPERRNQKSRLSGRMRAAGAQHQPRCAGHLGGRFCRV